MPARRVSVLVRRVFGGEEARDCEKERVGISDWEVCRWRQQGRVLVDV